MELIANPFTPIPKSPKSHVRGWALHWADILGLDQTSIALSGDSLADAETIYIDHGVNTFPGQLNLFGGVNDNVADRIIDILINTDATIVGLDYSMSEMGYVDNLIKRIGQPTFSSKLSPAMLEELGKVFASAEHSTQMDWFSGSVAIGDSHTTSYASSGQIVERANGMTLFSALRDKTFRIAAEKYADLSPEIITLVAGSIDIRHHLMRQDHPIQATRELMKAFVQEAEYISGELLCEVELACPVPVEFEGRKVPKTGFYKGSAFAGTQEERAELTEVAIDTLTGLWSNVVSPPHDWYVMDPEQYAKENMELSSSVHIAPTKYRRLGNWHV